MRHRLLALSLLALLSWMACAGLAEAKCLTVDEAANACRYPQGDAWCREKFSDGRHYAYRDNCQSSTQTASSQPAPAPPSAPAAPAPPPAPPAAQQVAAAPPALPEGTELPDTYTNDLGMEFALIPAGSFMMGCNASFENCGSDELPQHRVRIASPFYLGVTEVTQEQWVTVMGNNPSNFKSRTNPVEQVSWHDAQAFIRALNAKEGCSGCYRLPSEAEWEYAARAGTTTAYWFGDSADELGQYAWFYDNSNEKTHPVGQTPANPWGLSDMHGNVLEWVQDCYHESYSGAPADGSAWTTGCLKDSSGSASYGLRGGSWGYSAGSCRVANRYSGAPDSRSNDGGFRVVRVVSPGLR